METLSLTKEQKNQVIGEFIDSIKDCFKLTQFVLMKLSEEAIRMNAGELVLSQGMNHWKNGRMIWHLKLYSSILRTRLYLYCKRLS